MNLMATPIPMYISIVNGKNQADSQQKFSLMYVRVALNYPLVMPDKQHKINLVCVRTQTAVLYL